MENSQLPKAKILEHIKKNLAIAGIVPNLVTQSYPLNGKILLGFLTLGISIICNLMFTFCEAKTFIEYTQSICIGAFMYIVNFGLFNLILNVEKLFKLFEGCENIINTS